MDPRRYASKESTTVFHFNNLVVKIKKGLQKRFPDVHGDDFEKLMYKALRTFRLNAGKPNEQSFDYTYSPNKLGGVRWYVKCPKCSGRALDLYLPDKLKDREQLYLCVVCHKLKNASIIMGASKQYLKVIRPLKQLEKIRSELLKKTMTPVKAQPLLDQYKIIEEELAASPEYRLWRFQKEHGIV